MIEGAGNRSAVVDVASSMHLRFPMPTLTGGDSHAAVVVERLNGDDRRLVLAASVVRAFRDETSEVPGFQGLPHIEQGRYRLTLLGDAPVRAEWQLQDPDAPGLQVKVATPAAAAFHGRAERLASGFGQARVDLPRALPPGRRALQMVLLTGTRAGAESMCATTGDDCPQSPLPLCLSAPAPCPPLPNSVHVNDATMTIRYVEPSAQARALRWSVEGYRQEPDRLRAAAIVF